MGYTGSSKGPAGPLGTPLSYQPCVVAQPGRLAQRAQRPHVRAVEVLEAGRQAAQGVHRGPDTGRRRGQRRRLLQDTARSHRCDAAIVAAPRTSMQAELRTAPRTESARRQLLGTALSSATKASQAAASPSPGEGMPFKSPDIHLNVLGNSCNRMYLCARLD